MHQIRNLSDVGWWLRKLARTVRTLSCLFAAQMFGEYVHNVGGGEIEYARYRWRGRDWGIPTGPLEDVEGGA